MRICRKCGNPTKNGECDTKHVQYLKCVSIDKKGY